jgi:lysophospholipase
MVEFEKRIKISSGGFMAMPDGHSIRYGIWHCQKAERQGSILLLGGRREFMEKYEETIGELNQRGFDVYSFDWRGQGLSSRLLNNRHKGFIDSYDTYLKDLYLFFSKKVNPLAVSPLIIFGHSMGGHIALRFIHDHPDVADQVVLTSPMVNILTSSVSRRLIRFIAWCAVKAGLKHIYVRGSGDYDPNEKFERNWLTSDPERFMDEKTKIAKNPDLALGGVTYGWLSATFKSIDRVHDSGFAEKITTPALIISAGDDKIVSNDDQRRISNLLKNCRFTEISGARHEILVETDAVRSVFWAEFDRFTGVRS